MAEHTQGPGMGTGVEAAHSRASSLDSIGPREAAGENSVWSVSKTPGAKQRRLGGLDVLLTKAAVEFQSLRGPQRATEIKRNCDILREALGIDALIVAQFDADHERIETVVGASGLFSSFNPDVLA